LLIKIRAGIDVLVKEKDEIFRFYGSMIFDGGVPVGRLRPFDAAAAQYSPRGSHIEDVEKMTGRTLRKRTLDAMSSSRATR
jgi:hypothetical protein